MALFRDPITSISDTIGIAINKIWPDKSEQEKEQLAAAVALVQGQLEINKVEAANSSSFVSGWRPFIGWICGLGLGWNYLGLPITQTVVDVLGKSVALTQADMSTMMPLLFGILGLGGLRTYEKVQGVAK